MYMLQFDMTWDSPKVINHLAILSPFQNDRSLELVALLPRGAAFVVVRVSESHEVQVDDMLAAQVTGDTVTVIYRRKSRAERRTRRRKKDSLDVMIDRRFDSSPTAGDVVGSWRMWSDAVTHVQGVVRSVVMLQGNKCSA